MPSKQELMEIMENRLPGESLPLSDHSAHLPVQPPAYPDLQKYSFASPQQAEQQQQQEEEQQQHHTTVFTIRQPTINCPPALFGTRSHLVYCPSCHFNGMSRCEYKSGMMTHIIATILCFTTCCCCVPYCINSCKSARHFCHNCGSYLGSHTK